MDNNGKEQVKNPQIMLKISLTLIVIEIVLLGFSYQKMKDKVSSPPYEMIKKDHSLNETIGFHIACILDNGEVVSLNSYAKCYDKD